MEEILLTSQSESTIVLKLNNEKKHYVVEEILGVHNKVYSDEIYFIKLNSDKKIKKLMFM